MRFGLVSTFLHLTSTKYIDYKFLVGVYKELNQLMDINVIPCFNCLRFKIYMGFPGLNR